MSNAKGHILGGFIFYVLFLITLKQFHIFLSKDKIVLYFFVCIFSSLVPDIDMKRSKIHKLIFYTIVSILFLFSLYAQTQKEFIMTIVLLSVFIVLMNKVKHRKFFHSLPFGIIYSMGIGFLVMNFNGDFLFSSISAFVGFFSHIVLDRMV